jgi:hypothetical protein
MATSVVTCTGPTPLLIGVSSARRYEMGILLLCIVVFVILAVMNKVRRGSFSFWQRKGPRNW